MTMRDRAVWALAVLLSLALLMALAVWNGFPLLQYDTGGYLARWYEGTLVPSRAVVYGLILTAGAPLTFWPVVLLQSGLTVWILALTLRAHKLARPLTLLAVIAAMSALTTLPWLSAILLTDIFCGLGVLALYLLLMRSETLTRGENIGLIVLIAVAAATHSATLAVLIALMVCAALLWLIDRGRKPAILGQGVMALVLGAVLVLTADFAVAKRLAWTPGGFALSFGRMLQDDIVKRYLDDHCPDRTLQLCAYKAQLPNDADEWFWGNDLFDKLGRFAGLGPEMAKIATESVIDYPGQQLKTAAVATVKQLVDVHTGEGVITPIWHTYAIIKKFTPQLAPAMNAAHQQRGEIGFTAINRIDYPLALIATALLPIIVLLAWRRKIPPDLAELAGAATLAILANAFVCGALSNPHDRYGARIVWIAVFVLLIALIRINRQGRIPGASR